MAKENEEQNVEIVINEMTELLKKLMLLANTLQRFFLNNEIAQCKPEAFQALKKSFDLFHHQVSFLEDLGFDLWQFDEQDEQKKDQ